MSKKANKASGRKQKKSVKSSDLRGAKYLLQIRDLLLSLRGHKDDPKRLLHYDEFCCWLIIFFFTPVLDSMRGLQHASDIATFKRKLKLPRFSLGSFSEAANIFDPSLLEPIIEELSSRLEVNIDVKSPFSALERRPTAVDGTLLRALPSMVWALWLNENQRAAKLHMQFDLLKGTPEKPSITHAQSSEIEEMRERLEAGRLYVTDRGYFDFSLMAAIIKARSSFVARVRSNIAYEIIEEKELSEQDRQQGIEADLIVRPGCVNTRDLIDRPLRLVRIQVHSQPPPRGAGRVDRKSKHYRTRSTDHTLTLLTDQLDLDLSHIALLYRNRWQIELFFRWFKKVLQADTLLSYSENGLTIVVYCALISSMLVALWTGRKPTKRTFEILCFFFSGWAEQEDLIKHLECLNPENEK